MHGKAKELLDVSSLKGANPSMEFPPSRLT